MARVMNINAVDEPLPGFDLWLNVFVDFSVHKVLLGV